MPVRCESCAQLKIQYNEEDPFQEIVLCDFQVQDNLPDLPHLNYHADRGCELCAQLVDVIQRASTEPEPNAPGVYSKPVPVTLENARFRTEYYANADAVGDKNGVYVLILEMRIGDSKMQNLYFSVYTDDGRLHILLLLPPRYCRDR